MGVLCTEFDEMYLTQALALSGFGQIKKVIIPPDIIQQVFHFHKMSWVVLFLAWGAIVSVKFSYLFLFRALILRFRAMMIYWWCVVVFNIALCAYGFVSLVLACPKLYSMSSRKLMIDLEAD